MAQPDGIPLEPDAHVAPEFLINVPVDDTEFNQSYVQYVAELFVAKHLTLFKFLQFWNI